MKMTKIAFWRKVKENCEKNEVVSCIGIYDSDCPYGIDSKECKMCEGGNRKKALAYSEAYIKRHEGKSKKKVNVDTVKSNLKGDEHIVPNPDPTPLEIAKIIRDNEYVCLYVWDCTRQCPISNSKTGQLDCSINRKQLIDSYIKANEPACEHLVGDLCGNAFETCDKECLAYAEAYIKRHEGKSKKKVNVDTVKSNLKGDEHIVPNPDPTPLEIAKIIRDNEYNCSSVCIIDDNCSICPFDSLEDCGSGREINTESFKLRKQLIDSYIAEHEKVEPVIEPIKFDDPVPEYVCVVGSGIITCYTLVDGFKKIIDKAKDNSICDKVSILAKPLNDGTSIWLNAKNCYKTLDEAVAVAKKNWGLK